MHNLWSSLRVRLLLLAVLAAVPLTVLLVYNAREDRNQKIAELHKEAQQLVRLAAGQHRRAIQDGRSLLAMLAAQEEVYGDNLTACASVLTNTLSRVPGYNIVALAGPDGNVLCSGFPLSGPLNVADRPYFQEVYATGGTVAGPYVLGRATGKTSLPVAQPVVDDAGRTKGVIFAGIDAAWLESFVLVAGLPDGASVSLVGADGTILAAYPDPDRWVGKQQSDAPLFRQMREQGSPGTGDATWVDGARRLYAFTPLYGTPSGPIAFLAVGFSRDIALAPMDRALKRDLPLIALIVVLAVAVTWWASERLITRPARRLVQAAQRLADGDLAARSGVHARDGELGELARSFDSMARALQSWEDDLKRLHRRNQLVLDAVAEGINGLDMQGNITFVNPAAAGMLGWPAQELIGRPSHETWRHSRTNGSPCPKGECPVHAALRDGNIHHGDQDVFWRTDGTSFPVEYTTMPVRDEQGNLSGAVVTFSDITARKHAEQELRQRYAALAALHQTSEVVAVTLDLELVAQIGLEATLWALDMDAGMFALVDERTQEVAIVFQEGLPQTLAQDIASMPRSKLGSGPAGDVVLTGEPLIVGDLAHDPRISLEGVSRSGFVFYSCLPVNARGRVLAAIICLSRSRRTFGSAEMELANSICNVLGMAISNARLFEEVDAKGREWERTFNTMGDGVFVVDREYRIVRANTAAVRMLGASPEPIIGQQCYWVVHGLDSPVPDCPSTRCLAEGRPCELLRQEPHLGNRWFNLSGAPLHGPHGDVIGVIHTIRDVTPLKESEMKARQAEAVVRAALAEKEVLLQEVHHRVKNNLQVMSSLLNLQATRVTDEKAARILQETRNRIRSMALVHEQLYRSQDLAHIAFDDLVRSLTTSLFHTYGASPELIRLELDVEPVQMPVEQAIPCGLIANELVSNCLKHAFPNGAPGKISVNFHQEDDCYSLVVRDNGVGLPAGFDLGRTATLGLELVRALTDQLKGVLEHSRDGCTEFRVGFPALIPRIGTEGE
ncbi:MAG: PAS domain-containing protein [Chloroflexi bacterium]|nr:PAS domain-containing protein [Chloroflexota bacterium]